MFAPVRRTEKSRLARGLCHRLLNNYPSRRNWRLGTRASGSERCKPGAAGALAHAAAACVAGTDPERMQQLPDLTGLKTEVIMPKSSRNQYDHSVRMVGLRTVEVDSVAELQEKTLQVPDNLPSANSQHGIEPSIANVLGPSRIEKRKAPALQL